MLACPARINSMGSKPRINVLAGQKFGRWTVVDPDARMAGASGREFRAPQCRCDCGTEKQIYLPNLVHGLSQSCGCLNAERRRERVPQLAAWARSDENRARVRDMNLANAEQNTARILQAAAAMSPEDRVEANRKGAAKRTRHGLSGRDRASRHPLYPTWHSMMARCYKETDRAYPGYGGRGIRVHEEWHDDPAEFVAWIEENLGPRPAGYSLNRIDNDGNYEPGNLEWADWSTQQRNKRKIAEMQAEINLLRAEVSNLQRELEKLKGGDTE